MRQILTGFGLATLLAALFAGTVPAAAEFFGCNDRPGKVLYTTSSAPSSATRYSRRYTHEYAAHSRKRVNYSRTTYVSPKYYRVDSSHW